MTHRKVVALLLSSLLMANTCSANSYDTPGESPSAAIQISATTNEYAGRVFSVTVPTEYPIHVNEYNFVTVGEGGSIINTGDCPVFIQSVRVTPHAEWQLTSWRNTMAPNEKRLAVRLFGRDVSINGTVNPPHTDFIEPGRENSYAI